jgi:hypothetical protein
MPSWLANFVTGDMEPGERQAAARVVLWAIVVSHIAWACGWIPGLQGFAFASEVDDKIAEVVRPLERQLRGLERDVADVRKEQRAARVTALEGLLFETRRAQCSAIRDENREAMRFYAQRMDQLRAEYHGTTGREYAPASCSELGIK